MKNIHIFEHTADIGIRLSRPSLDILFVDAARAMFDIIAPDNEYEMYIKRQVQIEANDLEQLLVYWLSELNYLFQTEQLVPIDFNTKVKNSRIDALVNFDKINPHKHRIEVEIKAVTFHKIYVLKQDELWKAQVIFDI